MPAAQRADLGVTHRFDATLPSVARIQDYLLLGKDNFAADRAVADALTGAGLAPERMFRAGRGFLRRAVGLLAGRGITQFLDLGCGMPEGCNTHEIARATRPDAKVVYVDSDPIVALHANARLATADGVAARYADIREIESVLDEAALSADVNFTEPVAVLLISVLDFIRDTDDPAGILAAIRDRLCPGSSLVIAAATSEGAQPAMLEAARAAYAPAGVEFTPRTRQQIAALFDGMQLLAPGLVALPEWRPARWADRTPLPLPSLCAVGELPR